MGKRVELLQCMHYCAVKRPIMDLSTKADFQGLKA